MKDNKPIEIGSPLDELDKGELLAKGDMCVIIPRSSGKPLSMHKHLEMLGKIPDFHIKPVSPRGSAFGNREFEAFQKEMDKINEEMLLDVREWYLPIDPSHSEKQVVSISTKDIERDYHNTWTKSIFDNTLINPPTKIESQIGQPTVFRVNAYYRSTGREEYEKLSAPDSTVTAPEIEYLLVDSLSML